jgi:hypothetical protein
MLQWFREEWEMATPGKKVTVVLTPFVVGLMFLALLWVLRNWQGSIPEEADALTVDQVPNLRSAIRAADSDDGPLHLLGIAERAVLERHFGVLGGIEKIASVSSLRFNGQVTFGDGNVQDVVVVKKGGDRMRTSVRSRVSQTTWVVGPDDNWRAVWINGQLREVRDLTALEIREANRYIYVVSELYLAQQNGWDLRYLGVKDFNYKMAHVFQVKLGPRHTVEYYIEPKTFIDIGRVDRVFADDGTLTVNRRLHSEHFDANGTLLPGKVETYVDNQLVQTFVLEGAQFNTGVLDSAFARPGLPVKP